MPDSLFQRVKAYLERNHMTQKQFVVGLIEAELEQDEAQYQASHPEEQEDKEESDDQTHGEETEEENQDEFAPQEAQEGPGSELEEQPAADQNPAPWTILRPVPRKFPRRMTGPRKPGRKKPKKRKKCSRTVRF